MRKSSSSKMYFTKRLSLTDEPESESLLMTLSLFTLSGEEPLERSEFADIRRVEKWLQ